MATIAQKRELEAALAKEAREDEEKRHKDQIGRVWAYVTLIFMLMASVSGNVASGWEYGLIGCIISGLPALGLFLMSTLLERMTTTWPIYLLLYIGTGLTAAYSWYHMAHLVLENGQPEWIAWTFPATVDIPLVMANLYLMQLKRDEIGRLVAEAMKATMPTVPANTVVPEVVVKKVEADKPLETGQMDTEAPKPVKAPRAPRKRASTAKPAVA